MNCVHKYTGIYDGIDLFAFKGVLLFQSEVYSIHLLLSGVHKYFDNYDSIGLLALKGVVVFQSGVYSICVSIS